ncbi:peptide-methionine (R)-S-oxide reductase MsrB [Lacipirellula parvula]|uniref:peptide-methionine (R)-S-oxide reductase n=1 Tax=Lacipirellula parvula TaxID=2650471 RepID=A0A5K7XIN5_9BACT|nr:peptide-methionine (R)-S-oxide reductase MsrB [Lacipirellula parvula]BBO35962.1 reductase MsrB [Lacipirellula parvula]
MSKLAFAFVAILGLGAMVTLATAQESQADKAAAKDAKEAKEAKEASEKEAAAAAAKAEAEDPESVDWTQIDWGKRLTRLQYRIMREADTERPFRNEFWDFFKPGEYRCAGCGLPLFEADAKFDSECGWPSFDKTIAKDTVTEHIDHKMQYPRTEIRCRRCEAHLGHVFNDGPTKTGLRYCLNSASMKFVSEKQLDKEIKTAKEKGAKPKASAPAETAESDKTGATVETGAEKP